jgi:hypothetical protein
MEESEEEFISSESELEDFIVEDEVDAQGEPIKRRRRKRRLHKRGKYHSNIQKLLSLMLNATHYTSSSSMKYVLNSNSLNSDEWIVLTTT